MPGISNFIFAAVPSDICNFASGSDSEIPTFPDASASTKKACVSLFASTLKSTSPLPSFTTTSLCVPFCFVVNSCTPSP